jgi:cation diffusion facilitator CzcD-associated flavoprotein CzcO
MTTASKQVAIIGGGPSGIVAARWLKAQGFVPVIFEQSDDLGGQWNGTAATAASGRPCGRTPAG